MYHIWRKSRPKSRDFSWLLIDVGTTRAAVAAAAPAAPLGVAKLAGATASAAASSPAAGTVLNKIRYVMKAEIKYTLI